MSRFLYDTAIFVYAQGAEHPYRDPCRRVVELAGEGALLGEASVEMVQEFTYVRARRTGDRSSAVENARAVGALCQLHPFTRDDLDLALSLLAGNGRLDPRDAVHAATALNHGIELILTTDRAFDAIPGLQRVDPTRAEEMLLPR